MQQSKITPKFFVTLIAMNAIIRRYNSTLTEFLRHSEREEVSILGQWLY